MNITPSAEELSVLASSLFRTELFERYSHAFQLAHGCALRLMPDGEHKHDAFPALPFAAEMCASVLLNGRTFVHLYAGPIRISHGKNDSFDVAVRQMLDDGCTAAQLGAARRCFDNLPVMNATKAQALETMLQLFALQLGEIAERLFLQTVDNDPESVKRAKCYITAHLTETIMLDRVAEHAGISPFHFCKVFKRATGLTCTEFVNKARVEEAKRLLLKPQSRVAEIAYDVGFQSLSQFNRSFRRVTTESPTQYRVKQRRPVIS